MAGTVQELCLAKRILIFCSVRITAVRLYDGEWEQYRLSKIPGLNDVENELIPGLAK